ncbi:CS012 protein, partial [Alectura lathami]|nr:CS012 protein [Alectura lathami]
VGAALGGLFAVWMTSGKFKPVSQIISQLPPAKKKKIYDEVVAIFKGLHWSDIAEVIALVKGSAELKQQLIKVLENYFKKHLNAEIQYGK